MEEKNQVIDELWQLVETNALNIRIEQIGAAAVLQETISVLQQESDAGEPNVPIQEAAIEELIWRRDRRF